MDGWPTATKQPRSASCSRLYRETHPDLAGRRAAIAVLAKIKPGNARAILRGAAADGPDGRRHVAAGVLANLGEEPALYRETTRQWLLIDLLTGPRASDLRENLTGGASPSMGVTEPRRLPPRPYDGDRTCVP